MTTNRPQPRANGVLDLARMMIKQARLLKNAGLIAEAHDLAERAIAINTLGHRVEARPVPVRASAPRRR